ncbi:gamma-glutamylcyclotransferase [Fertoebacter nigrum]|uniref:Gamma-glutamylcyclotransferase n=1 Tax=Fertoeibacter niger TaxID=2656921 RepID=A0A8X8H6N3_9RHOB|nr:gamma-glutamylcyclotransferase family protein [Fertoeibacter niger]NUB46703.1 gamma-glutamylcyclotransferase [Fertoeibacter niger]
MAPASPAQFFGYGSLVNRATHGYAPALPATLPGWRRAWLQLPGRPFAILSAEPAPGQIDGLLAAVPGDDWAALDLREALYRRHPVQVAGASAHIYAVPDARPATAETPILRSYLDAVIQGFLREHGPQGAARFHASTAHWVRVLDDRSAPLYPRAQRLTARETAAVDALISAG